MNKTSSSYAKSNVKSCCSTEINVTIKELILTPLTCAAIINEIIKLLVHQKSQIPYPYNWLKSVVNRKKETISVDESKCENIKIEQHFKIVSSAFSALEELMRNLNDEFKSYGNNINQVLIIFGATVFCPKEVFRICLGGFLKGHSEDNHLYANLKKQHLILRDIVLAEEWLAAINTLIPPTNMFVLIQKKGSVSSTEFFQLNEQYSEPERTKNITINLKYDHDTVNNCCDGLKIFNDENDLPQEILMADSQCSYSREEGSLMWYQAKVVLQGFKECYVNKVSATELW